ncbi:hypothetical protein CALVIDRAFT_524581 [Calocera viscosa TUFC12733]|uniref:DUF952-domain-containing protein n=1 Tax=Calocera viscosa (strain TUFC12733) TaxID=1330018 RepID=A0A167RFE9_CALVF|nr:hypothetical protein CALVIDRAFT_524581 [Calocera viscosa TUFC12733]
MAVPDEPLPVYLFKILSPSEFPSGIPSASSLSSIPTVPSTALDKSEGFIHMSRARQLALPLSRFFADVDEIVLVRVVWDKIKDKVRWDRIASGDEYPHLLRELRGEDCDDVKVVRREGKAWPEVIESQKGWVWS